MATLLHLRIGMGKIAFGKAEIINSIQQVGFAPPIKATNTGYLVRKGKLRLAVIFKLRK